MVKVLITKTSDIFRSHVKENIKEFKNAQDMLEYGLSITDEIVISKSDEADCDYTMELYDDYRE